MQQFELIGHSLRLHRGQRQVIQLQHQRKKQRAGDGRNHHHHIQEAQAQESRLDRIPQEMPSETWPAHVVAALLVQTKWSWFLNVMRPPPAGS